MKIVEQLKREGEDFEFYPTTDEIIKCLYKDILSESEEGELISSYQNSFLDIGAGNCKVYQKIKEMGKADEKNLLFGNCFAIEKSKILIQQMPNEVIVVGSNFHENTLIDKKVDVIYSNPPYSEYQIWMEKIIKEANAKIIYLLVPRRWGSNRAIIKTLKQRGLTTKLLGSFDFLNSKDRKARAFVSLLKIVPRKWTLHGRYSSHYRTVEDPFKLWFKETFKINLADEDNLEWKKEKKEKEKKKKEISSALVSSDDIIKTLVELYNRDLDKLIQNYVTLGRLDAEILKELGVNLVSLLSAFKMKIEGLKNLYWKEVFDKVESIIERLTSKSRDKLLKILFENTSIDFTYDNIQSVVIWIIKNANKYFEEQMLEVYDNFTTKEGITLYKSNRHFEKDTWRYIKESKGVKYALDYRIVLHGYVDCSFTGSTSVGQSQKQYVKNIIVIAKNLGFNIRNYYDLKIGEKSYVYFVPDSKRILKSGTKTLQGKIDAVYCYNNTPNENGEESMIKDGIEYIYDPECSEKVYQYLIGGKYYYSEYVLTKDDIFTTVKCFKNGNVHFQFNKKFIKRLNLEVGRLRGWIKSPQEASNEFDIELEEAVESWGSNFSLLPQNIPHLLPSFR